MTCIEFEGNTLELQPDESVLEGLLRHGHDIPNGCRAGACQACILSADEGLVPSAAQQGLSDAQKALNYFLSCQCKPEAPLALSTTGTATSVSATVLDKTWLGNSIIRLRLSAPLDFKAGQYATLWSPAGIGRCYSLASLPDDGFLEFHIKVLDNGAFSQWLNIELQVGDHLPLQGPLGNCIFTAKAEQPLLLSAIGTGLAPIYGILRDALAQHHSATMTLLLGSKQAENFYLVEELKTLQQAHSNLKIRWVAQNSSDNNTNNTNNTTNNTNDNNTNDNGDKNIHADCQIGDIYTMVREEFPDMKGFRVFLCGGESFVKKMRRQCFMAGANMQDISADTFLAAG